MIPGFAFLGMSYKSGCVLRETSDGAIKFILESFGPKEILIDNLSKIFFLNLVPHLNLKTVTLVEDIHISKRQAFFFE